MREAEFLEPIKPEEDPLLASYLETIRKNEKTGSGSAGEKSLSQVPGSLFVIGKSLLLTRENSVFRAYAFRAPGSFWRFEKLNLQRLQNGPSPVETNSPGEIIGRLKVGNLCFSADKVFVLQTLRRD